MLDTGSTISAISPTYLATITHAPVQSVSHFPLSTANNAPLNVLGIVSLNVTINHVSTIINAYVVDNLCTDLLLGGDWFDINNVTVCYYFKTVTIRTPHGQTRTRFEATQPVEQSFAIRAACDIVIPPLTSRVIRTTTPAHDMASCIFTPAHRFGSKHHIVVPHALLSVHNQTTALSLLNTTHSAKTIFKDTKLGDIRCFEQERCCYVAPQSPPSPQPSPLMSANTPATTLSFDQSIGHLSSEQQHCLLPILNAHSSLFDLTTPTTINMNVSHRIPIKAEHQPVQSYPYRKAAKERELISSQVDEMLRNHVIRPSSSPWSSPVVIVRKKDGTPRFCVDYRKLNLITERDVYPLPHIDDIIDRLAGSRFFTTLDLKSGYWQVPIAEEDKCKTAFVTTDGLFEFNVLPFGLSNAPATFQRTINTILGSLRWDIALVYLDDIIIYSRTLIDHLTHLTLVLTALSRANVKLNLTKCSFMRKELDYLGYRITQHGIKPTTRNVRKTVDFPQPTSTAQAYSFVQMAQYYRRFIPSFSTLAAPLTKFKVKSAPFVWDTDCEHSFQTIKKKLGQYPLLSFPHHDSTLQLKLHTDASNNGIGGVLHQSTDHGDQPITFLSRSLSATEKKFSTVEKECLALVWCITKLRPYLYGQRFVVWTDHHPLCWLNSKSSKNGRLDRWSIQLQEYTFDIKHTPGKSNCVADCLSRFPSDPPDDIADTRFDLMVHTFDHHQLSSIVSSFDSTKIAAAQSVDAKIQPIFDKLSSNVAVKSFCLTNGVVCKLVQRPGHPTLHLPVIPKLMINDLLAAFHDHPLSGHMGLTKTWLKIRDRFYWPGMYRTVKSYISACFKCQQCKVSRQTPAGLLEPIESPSGVFDLIGLDFLGPLQRTPTGNKYILVCTDYLSKWAITQAVPDCTAETAARFLVEKVILQYGAPKKLLTDQGTHFVANLFEAITSRCGIHHITASTYHPQTNGLTERFNSTLAGSIRTYVNQQQSDWDEFLSAVTFAYNTSKQASTEIEPFKLMFGRTPSLPFDPPKGIVDLSSTNDYYLQLTRFLQQAKALARRNVHNQQVVYKNRYDQRRQHIQLRAGQLVLLKQMMPKYLKKFSPKYYGPFHVIQQRGRLSYLVKHVDDGYTEVAHVSRIRIIS